MKIAINGFGRIGRSLMRAIFEQNRNVELVAINSLAGSHQSSHLLKYDSVHGRFNRDVKSDNNTIIIDNLVIPILSESNLDNIKWQDVDIVMECTGKFNNHHACSLHLKNGCKSVVMSGPSSDSNTKTIIFGVNQNDITSKDFIISPGSCTTNAAVPLIKLIHDNFVIKNGFITTIHAYTNDQNILDNSHRDLRRARACGLSMIPTSTGLNKTLKQVIPSLDNKISASAIRVPTPNVSMIDAVFRIDKSIDLQNVNQFLFDNKSQIIGNSNGNPLVSIDFIHTTESITIDSLETYMIDDLLRIVGWYDNEWAFVTRMLDIAEILYEKIT